jgi:hypothetical protein
MIPVGYMAKRVVKKPDWLKATNVVDLYSVSSCFSEDFADYINYWKHNGYWFFDSPEIIRIVAKEHSIPIEGTRSFTMKHTNWSSMMSAGRPIHRRRRFRQT